MTGVTPHGIRYPDGASKAKNLGPELQQMAEDIDAFIDSEVAAENPVFVAQAKEAVLTVLGTAKCVHLAAGRWAWDGPNGALATDYIVYVDGRWRTAETLFPKPHPTVPAIVWP